MSTSSLLAKVNARIEAAKALRAQADAGTLQQQQQPHVITSATTQTSLIKAEHRLTAAKVREIQAREDTFIMPGSNLLGFDEVIRNLGDRQSVGMDGNVIELNDQQYEVVQTVSSGKSCVIIGPAGSGKSTTQRAAALALIRTGQVSPIKNTDSHKWLTANRPGIIVCSYTRRAVNNIRKILPPELQANCMTIHRLLEFSPQDVAGEELRDDGTYKTSRIFLPQRHRLRPLSSDIHTIIIEESGMVSTDLYEMLIDALPKSVQFVYLGDLYQLPPPMGTAILGYKMNEFSLIELDRVYRTGEDSPILALAHRIKDGMFIKAAPVKQPGELLPRYPALDKFEQDTNGIVCIKPWRKKIDPITCNRAIRDFMIKELEAGKYNPETDIILCPYEKETSKNTHEELVSTININKHLANYLSKKRGAPVQEVISGMMKHYLAVGDKVLHEKMDMEIVAIEPNPKYLGSAFRAASVDMDRWGHMTKGEASLVMLDMDDQIAALAAVDDIFSLSDTDMVNQASHVIKLRHMKADCEDGEDAAQTISISKAGDVNGLLFGYAITVYKSQGSEWQKVYLTLHHSHARHTNNEMLYTAVTRAKKQLVVLCEPETFDSGIKMRVIKGKTLAEKAEFFKGKAERDRAGELSSFKGMRKILDRALSEQEGDAKALVALSQTTLS